jgi:hypothetical protein
MRSACFLILLLSCLYSNAQQKKDKAKDTRDTVSTTSSPGDDLKKFIQYAISKRMDSLLEANDIPAGNYIIVYRFTIDEKGNLQNFTALKDPYGLGTFVVNAVKEYDQKLTPDNINGQNVKSYRQQSIRIEITGVDETDDKWPYTGQSICKIDKPLPAAPGCCGDILHIERRVFESGPQRQDTTRLAHGGIETVAVTDMKKWRAYLQHALDSAITDYDKIPPGNYIATVNMVIDKEGRLLTTMIADDPGYKLAQRFKAIIAQYPGRWIAATHNGRTIKYFCSQSFSLDIRLDKEVNCPAQKPQSFNE